MVLSHASFICVQHVCSCILVRYNKYIAIHSIQHSVTTLKMPVLCLQTHTLSSYTCDHTYVHAMYCHTCLRLSLVDSMHMRCMRWRHASHYYYTCVNNVFIYIDQQYNVYRHDASAESNVSVASSSTVSSQSIKIIKFKLYSFSLYQYYTYIYKHT